MSYYKVIVINYKRVLVSAYSLKMKIAGPFLEEPAISKYNIAEKFVYIFSPCGSLALAGLVPFRLRM